MTSKSNRKTPTGADARVAPERPPAVRQASIHRRMVFTVVCLLLGMAAATGQVAVLQLVEGPQLRREAARNYVRTAALDDWRGDIVDRDGATLAVTAHRWGVAADPSRLNRADARALAGIMAPLLDRDADELEVRLSGRSSARLGAKTDDPPARVARQAVRPVSDVVAKVFDFPPARFERKLSLLEYFYRMDQIRTRGVYRLVDTLDHIADLTARAISAGADDLRFFPTVGRRFAYLARDVDDEVARRVDDARLEHAEACAAARERGERCRNPMATVQLLPEPRRYYPKRELGTQVVGLVGPDNKALGGIERAMDGVIAGGQHTTRVVRDRRGRSMYLDGIPEDAPLAAPTVELTLDQQIQALAERALNKACQASGARAGYTVVLDVNTGEILGAATYPTFNPNTYREFFRDREPLVDEREALAHARADLAWAAEWPGLGDAFPGRTDDAIREARGALARQTNAFIEYEHAFPSAATHAAFQHAYEPGSIMKVFTLAAWLEEEVHPLDHTYPLMDGHWELEDADENVIHDDHRFEIDEADVVFSLKKSSNIVFGQMGEDLGPHLLARYLREFGFGAVTASGFPGESAGLLRDPAEWKRVETINIAFGQGIAATGVQLASALAALANDGKRMAPLLVRRVVDADGREVRRWEPRVLAQVVSPRAARTTLDIMRTVVEPGGTGVKAYIPEYPVAGKTGTGQKPHLRKKGYAENMWVGTFFGVAPVDEPRLAVLVLIDEPQGKRYGGVVAAPAFREIMRGALHHLGAPSPYAAGRQVAWLDPQVLALRRAADQPAQRDLTKLAPPVDPVAAGDVPVPDFRGMTMDQAWRAARQVHLTARLVGSGTARTQDLAPHDRVPAGARVTVVFEPRAPVASALRQAAAPPTTPPVEEVTP